MGYEFWENRLKSIKEDGKNIKLRSGNQNINNFNLTQMNRYNLTFTMKIGYADARGRKGGQRQVMT